MSQQLTSEFGRGFSEANIWNFRQFYLTHPAEAILYALRRELSWSHYRLIMRVENPQAREYYTREAAEQHWSTRQLERNINSLYYERLLASRRKSSGAAKVVVAPPPAPDDHLKDPEVNFTAIPEGPFYRPMRLGEQKRLIINTTHPFYTKVYDVTPDAKAALEVLLFVLAERELASIGDTETFYKAECQKWSEQLRYALDTLIPDDTLTNRAAAMAEQMHVAVVNES